MGYIPSQERYTAMQYNRCGNSGVLLPAISLGLWQNFGSIDNFENGRKIIRHAFDKGITHFDLANNYGPVSGSAEENFGKILRQDFGCSYRDEMLISSKAGYTMWQGPYGDWGSRKHLITSCNQSLKRMGLEYIDIFYSHRPDPNTPVEETMIALDYIVRSGKALYAGICNYNVEQSRQAIDILKNLGTPCLIHQPKYSMFVRWVEDGLLDILDNNGIGCIAFAPLEQSMRTASMYIKGITEGLRPAGTTGYYIKKLNEIAQKRNQSLAQMSLAWVLKDKRVTSVLIGAGSAEQLDNNLAALNNLKFTDEELSAIEAILH
ncbi:aldo/keto reductase [Parafilimonas sp.]|uniref:aldo/keto reductase n=1 Tax=Parafilimonas sp. TaxID=1969739 RepID=UPI0039E2BDA6